MTKPGDERVPARMHVRPRQPTISRSSLRRLVYSPRLYASPNVHRLGQRLRWLTNKDRKLRGTTVSLCMNLGRA